MYDSQKFHNIWSQSKKLAECFLKLAIFASQSLQFVRILPLFCIKN